jgi:hypothetical protein
MVSTLILECSPSREGSPDGRKGGIHNVRSKNLAVSREPP